MNDLKITNDVVNGCGGMLGVNSQHLVFMIGKGIKTIKMKSKTRVGLWVFHGNGERERRWGLPIGRVKVGLGKGLGW